MMTAEQLKESILQLAVQGKLVKQNVTDESADILIQNISKRKQQLIAQNMLKKEKQLLPITEDVIPFDIPNSWKWIRLGNYAERVTDYVASGSFASLRENAPSLKTEDYAILVKTADFANGFTKNLTYTTKHGYEFLSNSNLFGGELVLSNIGSIGKVFVVPKLEKKMTLAPNSVMIRLTDDQLRDYLYFFLLSPLGFNELVSITSGTAMKKFNKTDLKTILVPIPPLEEQKRIVAKIEELMPFIEQYAAASTKLDTLNTSFPDMMKKSILQEAIQGKLVPQDPNDEPASELLKKITEEKKRLIKEGKIKKQKELPAITEDEIPFEIPENWEWVRVGSLSTIVTKGTTPRGGNVAYVEKGIGFLRAENVAGLDKLDLTNLKCVDEETNRTFLSRSIIKSDDILITIAGTLGRTGLVREKDLPLNANQAVSIVRLVTTSEIDLKYLIYVLNAPILQKNLTGQQKITAIPNLTLEIISNCLLPIPPLNEQKRIVAKIEELLPLCEKMN